MIKVAVWGTGMMGQGLLGYILDRPRDVELVGAVVTNPTKEGKTVGELIGRDCDVRMTTDHQRVLAEKPDVVCICTQSNLDEITGQVEPSVKAGADVLCIAEKLAYPWASDPAWAERFDALAKERGVSILGTGVNPGFVLDALIVVWSSICLRIDKIEAERVNDLSPFGPTVMKGQGVGTTVEGFERGVTDGSIVGHIGFPESIQLIAKALGWGVDRVEETREPVITTVERSTPHVRVAPGDVCGCRHVGKGFVGGELKIELIHPQQIQPEAEGVETGDYIRIFGDPNVNMVNAPEIPGGKVRTQVQATTSRSSARHRPACSPSLRCRFRASGSPRSRRCALPAVERCAAGDWVEVTAVLVEPAERASGLPEETAEKPLVMWVKGFARSEALLGENLEIETMTGRVVTGALSAVNPGYTHAFGRPAPELVRVGGDLRVRIAAYRAGAAAGVAPEAAEDAAKGGDV